MALNIARVVAAGEPRWGVASEDGVRLLGGPALSTGGFVSTADPARLRVENGAFRPWREVQLLSPITSGQQFLCQGANYRQHMIESGLDPDAKTYNMIFTKAPGCLAPADVEIVRPAHVRFLDYEIELGLVLRRPVDAPRSVAAHDLEDLIAGLVVVNDVSARDIQIPQTQFYKGKSYRTFGPVGPWLTLLERGDWAHLDALELVLKVNGAVRQRDVVANLVFKPAETLAELSGVHDLAAGDLIATGTPAGCALSVPSPRVQRLAALLPEATRWRMFMTRQEGRPYLQPGDVVEASIATPDKALDLGTQRNRVRAA